MQAAQKLLRLLPTPLKVQDDILKDGLLLSIAQSDQLTRSGSTATYCINEYKLTPLVVFIKGCAFRGLTQCIAFHALCCSVAWFAVYKAGGKYWPDDCPTCHGAEVVVEVISVFSPPPQSLQSLIWLACIIRWPIRASGRGKSGFL